MNTALKKAAKPEPKPKPRVAPPPVAGPSVNAYRPKKSAEEENDFLANLLGDLDAAPLPTLPKTRKRKSSPAEYSSPVPYRTQEHYASSSDGFVDDGFVSSPSDDLIFSPKKKIKTDAGLSPAVEKMKVHASSDYESAPDMEFDDIDMDSWAQDFEDDDLDIKPAEVKPADKKPIEPKKPDPDAVPAWLKVYDSLPVAEPEFLGMQNSTTTSTSDDDLQVLEPDGSLHFFWLEYLELEGKLYFTGKLKDKKTGQWLSCCVTVENLERNLFVLPREKRVELDENDDIQVTEEIPTPTDVRHDFDMIRKQSNIKSFKGKFVKRKYAFADVEVPRDERDWFKVVYPFDRKFQSRRYIPASHDHQSHKSSAMPKAQISTRYLVPIRALLSF